MAAWACQCGWFRASCQSNINHDCWFRSHALIFPSRTWLGENYGAFMRLDTVTWEGQKMTMSGVVGTRQLRKRIGVERSYLVTCARCMLFVSKAIFRLTWGLRNVKCRWVQVLKMTLARFKPHVWKVEYVQCGTFEVSSRLGFCECTTLSVR